MFVLLALLGPSIGADEAGLPRVLVEEGENLMIESFGARRIVRRGDVSYVGCSALVDGTWRIRVRPFDHTQRAFGDVVDIAPGTDNHSIMGLVADSQGYLHCVTGGHGRLVYVRTARPDDITEWTLPQQIADEGTYAMPLIGRDDRLYVFYRHKWINIAMQTCEPGGKWTRTKIIGTTTGNKGFYIMGVARGTEPGQQSLHVAGHFYGEPEAFGRPWPEESYGYRVRPWYIRSLDGGETWQKADGTRLDLPVTDETIDVPFDLEEPYDIPWSVDVTVDDQNRPHIFCAWAHRRPGPGLNLREVQGEIQKLPGQLWELTWDGGRWVRNPVATPSLLDRHILWPAAVFADGALHVAVTAKPTAGALKRDPELTLELWHLWSSAPGQWREERVDTEATFTNNWKLPDGSGVLELLWRGKPQAEGARAAIYYSYGLAGSRR